MRASLTPRFRIPIWLPPAPAGLAATALTPLQQLSAYLTLTVTPIITEELAPILGGVAASQRQLGLVRVIVAVTIGGWIGTALFYLLGTWRGPWVRRRFPQAGRAIDTLTRAVCKRPWRASFVVRFAFGARWLLPLACGVAHVRPTTFFVGSLAGSAAWSTVFVLVGYEFGEAAIHTLERVRSYDRYAYVLAAVAAVVGAIVLLRRRRRRRAAADTLAE